ncbi:MAG: SLC13 family permease [Kiritimatiellae bacterium]|jgi:di/tricarboxylate transporter|nr:SLC13 family permease [Kiritimatiellia bacterium]
MLTPQPSIITQAMTPDIALVLAVLVVTIVLFVTEAMRVDVIAITIMVALPWLGLIQPAETFSGLASNAVVAIIAVMILSHGLDSSGVVGHITRPVLRIAGTNERKIVAMFSAVAAVISAIMQNIGAAALLLPAMLRVSKKTSIPASRLLMPMGFVAILGGTLTLVGSGPLIILNDLLGQAGQEPYGLFSVTPIGLALVAGGIIYFLVMGKVVLPSHTALDDNATKSSEHDMIETWKLPDTMRRCTIPKESHLAGMSREEAGLWKTYRLHILSLKQDDEVVHAPWRFTRLSEGQELRILGDEDDFKRFVDDYSLTATSEPPVDQQDSKSACFAELVIPPHSPIAGKTMRQLALRDTHRVEPIILLSGKQQHRSDFSNIPLGVGDVIVAYGPTENLIAMGDNRKFALLTPVDKPEGAPDRKPLRALLCAGVAVVLALSGAHLSVALFSGALGMVLLKVMPMDDAYKAVDWRTVFLLAGLIPLGVAMEKTGGAKFIASGMMQLPHGGNPLVILTGVAILATLFSLFMSNVAATVLLVPLVVAIGQSSGISPRTLALLVAVAASNSFILPTHQVNALLMGPGGYHNRDYVRAGSIMSVIFIVIAVGLIYFFYL